MTAPLYSDCNKPLQCDKEGNRGLWFERFFDQYNERVNWEVGTEKTRWLFDHFNNEKVGDSQQLERYAQAQRQLTESLQGQSHVFTASWHFVTGMGNPHPVENGFAWHPTLGVPYLTGAAVKGLVRSYIENNLDTENPDNPAKQELLWKWFGSTDKDPQNHTKEMPARAGELIFFDALPTKPVSLGVDIMTPHMGKWYEKGGTDQAVGKPEAVPADWHDPVPVAFLVAQEITLLFSFALRRPSAIDLKDVQQVLTLALKHAGAGGKTATGYGEMCIEAFSCPWVDEKIQELALRNKVPENKLDQVICGKSLAEAWQVLTDEKLKEAALVYIRSLWKNDAWDNPQGKSAKKAKEIYTKP